MRGFFLSSYGSGQIELDPGGRELHNHEKDVSRAEQRWGKRRRALSPSSHSSSRLTINQPKGAITASAVNEMARESEAPFSFTVPCHRHARFSKALLNLNRKSITQVLDELKVDLGITF